MRFVPVFLLIFVLASGLYAGDKKGVKYTRGGDPHGGDLGIPEDHHLTIKDFSKTVADFSSYQETLPASFDWRDLGAVSPAKDQKLCNGCWAFASTAVVESRLLMYGAGLYDLAEQQQIACNKDFDGCRGGKMTALKWWSNRYPIQEQCAPFRTRTTPCKLYTDCLPVPFNIKEYYGAYVNDITQLKTSLYTDGPGYFRYYFYEDFRDYWFNAGPGEVYCCQIEDPRGDPGGHAVLLIGWDDEKQAWLCKNSWGENEGPNKDGTFWFAYSGHKYNMGTAFASVNVWQHGNAFQMLPVQVNPAPDFTNAALLMADINRIGRDQLVRNEKTSQNNRIYVGIANEEGTFEFSPTREHPVKEDWSNYITFSGDINDDNRADLIWNKTWNNGNRIYTAVSLGNSGFYFPPRQDHVTANWEKYESFCGDVDGDGKDDLIWNEKTGQRNRIAVGLSYGDYLFKCLPYQDHTPMDWQGYKTLAADVNGDGKIDLVFNETAKENNKIYVALSIGDGTFEFLPLQNMPGNPWEKYDTLTGDFNGDGRTDLLWNQAIPGRNRIYTALAHEDGSFSFMPCQDRPERLLWQYSTVYTADISGDGKTDLIWNEATEARNRFCTAISNGDGTFTFLTYQDRAEKENWKFFYMGASDISGDAQADIVWGDINGNRVFTALSDYRFDE